jgi:predicted nucleic acid-binding protein
MQGRICAMDSSCVIALDHAGLMPSLSFLFSRVLIPKAVRKELHRRRVTKDRLQALFADYAFFVRCDDYDRLAVDILLLERNRQGLQDRGEAETIVQASQRGAAVLIDDLWARQVAGSYDLDCHGTLWILERLFEVQLLSSAQVRESFRTMRNRGIRLPWDTVDSFLTRIGEDTLSP